VCDSTHEFWWGTIGEDVAWVGHAPDVEELTAALIGDARARQTPK
jgi:phosphohistidine phosphatase SixA